LQAYLGHAMNSTDHMPLVNYYMSIGRSAAVGIGVAIIDSEPWSLLAAFSGTFRLLGPNTNVNDYGVPRVS
jgi:hypothetical protein